MVPVSGNAFNTFEAYTPGSENGTWLDSTRPPSIWKGGVYPAITLAEGIILTDGCEVEEKMINGITMKVSIVNVMVTYGNFTSTEDMYLGFEYENSYVSRTRIGVVIENSVHKNNFSNVFEYNGVPKHNDSNVNPHNMYVYDIHKAEDSLSWSKSNYSHHSSVLSYIYETELEHGLSVNDTIEFSSGNESVTKHPYYIANVYSPTTFSISRRSHALTKCKVISTGEYVRIETTEDHNLKINDTITLFGDSIDVCRCPIHCAVLSNGKAERVNKTWETEEELNIRKVQKVHLKSNPVSHHTCQCGDKGCHTNNRLSDGNIFFVHEVVSSNT